MPEEKIDIEALIAAEAGTIADEMNRIARWAQSHEDVRHECNKLIDRFIDKARLKIKGRHEYGLSGGFVDSKYAGVVIECKPSKGPDRIRERPDAPGTRAAVNQIKQRFQDFQRAEGIEPEKLFGVGTDAHMMIFVRQRGGKFEVEGPMPITDYVLERLLRALVSLGAEGRSFTPQNLATQFGEGSCIAEECVRGLHEVITDTSDAKARTLFKQWKMLFGEVCGYDVEGRSPKIARLAQHYSLPSTARPADLLFALHTYYAVFMKLLAGEVVSSLGPLRTSFVRTCVAAPTSAALKAHMEQLEEGGIWSQLGITNFLEGDLFSWYLAAWDERVAGAVRSIVRCLDGYDPKTLSVEPAESRDLLKRLYQQLFPKSVRHDLGEYYTPDWLADHVLNELGYEGDPDKRLLDPACGSGTFLVMAINRIKRWFREHRHDCGYGDAELVRKIVTNVVGFDLNPLAVMAARTNYLMALRDLLGRAGPVEIPVYLCDSVVMPFDYSTAAAGVSYLHLKTAEGPFNIPKEVASSRDQVARYARVLESSVRTQSDTDEFLLRCRDEGLPVTKTDLHKSLYKKLRELDAENRNAIWTRIIKNAFAPVFIERVDYVAGNPPWVGWENLPDQYRDDMKSLWEKYGLFSLSGSAGRLGGGKKDLSMLFVYSCVDHFLKDEAKLGFVITQTVFKTKGAGDGFRRFKFVHGIPRIVLKPLVVHDLSAMQVFEGVTNRTAVLVCQRENQDFTYPVRYIAWHGPSRIQQDAALEEVKARCSQQSLSAIHVDPKKKRSPWLTAPPNAIPALQKVIGKSSYKAYAGCCTWLNGCYWISIIKTLPDGSLLIENLHDVGKTNVDLVPPTVIEPDLVYPLLRGRDVQRWKAEPSVSIILAQDPQTRRGIPESEMRRRWPNTYGYLKRFERQLRHRSGFRKYFKATDPFYSMYDVGPYTMAPCKVVWNRIDTRLQAVVVGSTDRKLILCQETHSFVPLESPAESHYLCAMVNSSPSDLLVRSYSVSKGFASPHVLEHIGIPQHSAADQSHAALSALSQRCHAAAAKGDSQTVTAIEAEIDNLAAKVWGISNSELLATQDALKEVPKASPVRRRER